LSLYLRTGGKGSCKDGPLSGYRDKLTVRIVGQPLFGAEVRHCEQARCRLCGNIVRAEVPAEVTSGVGSDYVTYGWPACAMLAVMHYFAGLPFKRLEALHESWGVPLADANQWDVVSASETLLLPLFKALERFAVTHATTLRIDDTGTKVVDIQRQINAEIKELDR